VHGLVSFSELLLSPMVLVLVLGVEEFLGWLSAMLPSLKIRVKKGVPVLL